MRCVFPKVLEIRVSKAHLDKANKSHGKVVKKKWRYFGKTNMRGAVPRHPLEIICLSAKEDKNSERKLIWLSLLCSVQDRSLWGSTSYSEQVSPFSLLWHDPHRHIQRYA